jgi:AcrR family transcriptional regulator
MEQSKKECILSAAVNAFARFGFKKASVEEIAREAGVAKGTIYLAAETKEDLFYQAVHREVRAWNAETAKTIDPRIPADQLLLYGMQAGLQYLDERPLVRELLFGNYHLMLPRWAERLDALRELGRSNIQDILRLGVRQGLFRADLDLEEVAKILQDVAISTFMFHDKGPDRKERVRRRIATCTQLLTGGLLSAAEVKKRTDAAA